MVDAFLADGLLFLHALFVIFAAAGAGLLFRWPRLAWGHLPAVLWGCWIELSGGICPLTPLENHFRQAAGQAGYAGDFLGHYLLRLLYPAGLTPTVQTALGLLLGLGNLALYGLAYRHHRRRHHPRQAAPKP
jgi:hypothetical protein